jgi:hypothetical protein
MWTWSCFLEKLEFLIFVKPRCSVPHSQEPAQMDQKWRKWGLRFSQQWLWKKPCEMWHRVDVYHCVRVTCWIHEYLLWWCIKMEAADSSEYVVCLYQTTLCPMPEEGCLQVKKIDEPLGSVPAVYLLTCWMCISAIWWYAHWVKYLCISLSGQIYFDKVLYQHFVSKIL